MKSEGNCNESVNNESKIMRESNSLYQINESEQIMNLTHRIHVRLIVFLIHYFDIMDSLKSDKTHSILIQ